jgi:hypothetical protein
MVIYPGDGNVYVSLQDGNLNKACPVEPTWWRWMFFGYGMANPMAAAGDIIVAGASGTPARKAKGANSRVFGVDASGVLDYRQVTTADLAANAVHAAVRSQTPTLPFGSSATALPNPLTGSGITFTVGTGSLGILLQCWFRYTHSVLNALCGFFLSRDNAAGLIEIGYVTTPIAGAYVVLSRLIWIPAAAIPAGSHTWTLDCFIASGGGTITVANAQMDILEIYR